MADGTAIVFPGMSPSRFADVGRFMVVNPFARKLVAAADERLGYSLVDQFQDTPGDYSEYAQVAFLVNCLALAQWAEHELGVTAELCTGPSFGEKPAIAYTRSLPFQDAVWMTAALARCIEEYFADTYQDVVTHSFIRTPEERLREVLEELAGRGEWYDISCYIDRDFFMVSLRERNLDWLDRRIRALGGMSLYTMRPPMHSAAFESLRRKASEEVVGELTFADPDLPVVSDQDGTVVDTAAGMRAMLLDSFVKPLRWPRVVDALKRQGVGQVCVCGPDSLFGRVRCTTGNFEVLAVNPGLALIPPRRRASA